MTDETKSDPNKAIEGAISCRSYLDGEGRCYIPLRVRDRAGLERNVGYDVQIEGVILSNFKNRR